MKTYAFILLTTYLFISCSSDGEKIIDRSIELSGGNHVNHKKISFDFRDKHYASGRKDGVFFLERVTSDSTGLTRDVFNNEGFKRYLNDRLMEIPDSMAVKYANSVNSVHYFAYLPYGLNDHSVNNELLEETEIRGQVYYKIKVWFDDSDSEVGDDEDVYVYWINKDTYFVDYLAYKFKVDGGGMRFREAYNPRNVGGIRFVDYNNFKPENKSASLYELDSLFESNKLVKVSEIELRNIRVTHYE